MGEIMLNKSFTGSWGVASEENIPHEIINLFQSDNIPEPQEFEDMLNTDAQDMADYAMQYESDREEFGDLEEPADLDMDIDPDVMDSDLPEEMPEIESGAEADIDLSELGEIAEEAEEGAEIIAALL